MVLLKYFASSDPRHVSSEANTFENSGFIPGLRLRYPSRYLLSVYGQCTTSKEGQPNKVLDGDVTHSV